jgi:hypothetical protein
VFVVVSVWSFHAFGQWVPPPDANPLIVLRETKNDLKLKRYQEVLRKYKWLYEEGHLVVPAFNSVRLSFVIGQWGELAKAYPPALVELREAQNVASKIVESGPQSLKVESFQNFEAFCRVMGEENVPIELFKKAAKADIELGKELFPYVRSALLERDDFQVLFEFMDPIEEYAVLSARIEEIRKQPGIPTAAYAALEKQFHADVCGLVRMLHHRNDAVAAERIVCDATQVLRDPILRKSLQQCND